MLNGFDNEERNFIFFQFCENSFPSFKTQISCLQYEASFLSTSQTKYCANLATRKYIYVSFLLNSWFYNLHVYYVNVVRHWSIFVEAYFVDFYPKINLLKSQIHFI